MAIIKILEERINQKKDDINLFFNKKYQQFSGKTLYNSFDIRHSNNKIAVVDSNCFPAGFNNIKGESLKKAQLEAKKFLKNIIQSESTISGKRVEDLKIIIIGENHSRNLNYLENLLTLQNIFSFNDNKARIANTLDSLNYENYQIITISEDKEIKIEYLALKNKQIQTLEGFVADIVILNNDLTDGVPELIKNSNTIIVPNHKLGWYRRKKSYHFKIYNQLAEELSKIIEIDSWFFSTIIDSAENIDFKNLIGIDNLANKTENLIAKISAKYQKYNIKDKPYCYIKADNGTYGMAVMPVFSGDDILEINKKERNKMNAIKGSHLNHQVIIQEGIVTQDLINNKTAEPLIYMINGEVIANLFRLNQKKDNYDNLNSSGAEFIDLQDANPELVSIGGSNTLQTYELLAKLGSLASSIEVK